MYKAVGLVSSTTKITNKSVEPGLGLRVSQEICCVSVLRVLHSRRRQHVACDVRHRLACSQNMLSSASQGRCPVSSSLPTHIAAKAIAAKGQTDNPQHTVTWLPSGSHPPTEASSTRRCS